MRSDPWHLSALAFLLSVCACTLAQCSGDQVPADGASGEGAQAAARAEGQGPAAQDPIQGLPPEQDRLHLLVSGSMSGRLEPCGCASGQLGGLARRMQHIGERRNYDLLIEGGDLVEGDTELDLEKLFTSVTILTGMQHAYDAVGIGPRDLALPLDRWIEYTAGVPLIASDLASTRADWPGRPFVQKEVRGRTVRIGALTLTLPARYAAEDAPVRLLTPAEGWRRALEGAAADAWRILVVHGRDTVARDLVPTLEPRPHLVVCCDDSYVEPAPRPETVAGVPVVYPGIRGRIVVDVMLYRFPDGPRAALELVPLRGSLTVPGGGGDPDVKQVLLAHRQQVKDEGVLQRLARQLPTPNGAAYVGSQTCQSCHPTAYGAWAKSKHALAWKTLQDAEADPKRYGWPVTHYPDCVSCHVVGYREQTGFLDFDETPQLAAVGCERCHGPGSEHVMSGGQKALGMHGGVQSSILCVQCHDFEQSPNFVYGERWKLIEHGREPHQVKKK